MMSCGQCSRSVSFTIIVYSVSCRVTSVGSSTSVHSVLAALVKPVGGYSPCKLLVAFTTFFSCLICGCGCCNSVAACAKVACSVSYFTVPAVFATIRNFVPHFAWLENSLPVAQCLGPLNLNWVLLMLAISCTSGCDIHLRYVVPAQSRSTKIVRTVSSVPCVLKIPHLRAFSMSFASYAGLAYDDPCHLRL